VREWFVVCKVLWCRQATGDEAVLQFGGHDFGRSTGAKDQAE